MGDNGLMRILVVEDDDQIASFVAKGLKQSGYAVDHCADGEEALTLATTTPYDAAVVDIQLPKLDGLSLVQRLRRQNNRLPVLFLSAKASVDDRVRGLQAGGDDYLTKPFAFSELLARVQALVRRATQVAEPSRLTVGDLVLEYEEEGKPRARVFCDKKSIIYLGGSVLNFEKTLMFQGFKFKNPQEATRCGCGHSFTVA